MFALKQQRYNIHIASNSKTNYIKTLHGHNMMILILVLSQNKSAWVTANKKNHLYVHTCTHRRTHLSVCMSVRYGNYCLDSALCSWCVSALKSTEQCRNQHFSFLNIPAVVARGHAGANTQISFILTHAQTLLIITRAHSLFQKRFCFPFYKHFEIYGHFKYFTLFEVRSLLRCLRCTWKFWTYCPKQPQKTASNELQGLQHEENLASISCTQLADASHPECFVRGKRLHDIT